MRNDRQTDIRRAILTALAAMPVGPLLAERTLAADAGRQIRVRPTEAEFQAELTASDQATLIAGIMGDVERLWKITPAGRLWLAENP